MTALTLDTFTRAYLICALWTSDPYAGQSGEWSEHDEWTIANIAPESLTDAIEDCRQFQEANRADLDEVSDTYHVDDSQHGHDFWLTRNGHGAGFWDRGYDLNGLGDRLTDVAHAFGECWISGPETNDQGTATDTMLETWDHVIYIN